ncbi:hypothetical protein D9M72_568820 [compost metagenome]
MPAGLELALPSVHLRIRFPSVLGQSAGADNGRDCRCGQRSHRQLKSVRVTFSAAKRLPFFVEIHSCETAVPVVVSEVLKETRTATTGAFDETRLRTHLHFRSGREHTDQGAYELRPAGGSTSISGGWTVGAGL